MATNAINPVPVLGMVLLLGLMVTIMAINHDYPKPEPVTVSKCITVCVETLLTTGELETESFSEVVNYCQATFNNGCIEVPTDDHRALFSDEHRGYAQTNWEEVSEGKKEQ